MDPNRDCITNDLTDAKKHQKRVEFHQFQTFTVPIFTGLGIANAVTIVFIICYFIYFLCHSKKLSTFTWLSLVMMISIEGLSCYNMLSYNNDVFRNCFLVFKICLSVTFLVTKTIGLILAFSFYQTVDEIFKFSLRGVLPNEKAKER